ncbi:GNAT family N-acetyltransferase [Phyllobacterium sp. K27]
MDDTITVQTKQFILREFCEADRAAFVACQLDENFRRFLAAEERGRAHAERVFDLFIAGSRIGPAATFNLQSAPKLVLSSMLEQWVSELRTFLLQ